MLIYKLFVSLWRFFTYIILSHTIQIMQHKAWNSRTLYRGQSHGRIVQSRLAAISTGCPRFHTQPRPAWRLFACSGPARSNTPPPGGTPLLHRRLPWSGYPVGGLVLTSLFCICSSAGSQLWPSSWHQPNPSHGPSPTPRCWPRHYEWGRAPHPTRGTWGRFVGRYGMGGGQHRRRRESQHGCKWRQREWGRPWRGPRHGSREPPASRTRPHRRQPHSWGSTCSVQRCFWWGVTVLYYCSCLFLLYSTSIFHAEFVLFFVHCPFKDT